MLPVLNVHLNDIAEIGFNPSTNGNSLIGKSFYFAWEPVFKEAEKKGLNFDSYLTNKIGHFLSLKKTKTPLIIYFTSYNDQFSLTVCSKRIPNFLNLFHSSANMPGYLRYGEEYVPSHSKPFIYYKDLQVNRVYATENINNNEYYISDFCSNFGLTTSQCDKETYEDIKNNPLSNMDCNIVPTESTTNLSTNGTSVIIHHAFINT